MLDNKIKEEYFRWIKFARKDQDLVTELQNLMGFEKKITDAYYSDLVFGTGGLRGIIGVGTNRINVYTIAKASQGLANYIVKNFECSDRKIAVSYDSRIKSNLFAHTASEVFAANGIKVYIYDELMPTPCLSFAVRDLRCVSGIMVTASHNSSEYNGYKVYGKDGCQITTKISDEIYNEIKNVDIFKDIKEINFDVALKQGIIEYIDIKIYDHFVKNTLKESLITKEDQIDKNVSIVYTPLNGTGLKPVLRVLREAGYTNLKVVEEQKYPNGKFPTCPYPNPEIKEAMALGVEYAKRLKAELLLATDPDCDRIGIAVKNNENDFQLLSGNEIGILLFDYICSRRKVLNKMPDQPVLVKTIVTTSLVDKIAEYYGVQIIEVLTGFKFIGEQIGYLEKNGRIKSYLFGFEESHGYLSGTYVRDKDAVNGVMLICEMFCYYKSLGVRLTEKLDEIYSTYGNCLDTLHSYEFKGRHGLEKMNEIMGLLRSNKDELVGMKIVKFIDYAEGINNLPKANVVKLVLENNCSIVIRPSGTEPKLKIYISLQSKNKKNMKLVESLVSSKIDKIMNK